MKADPIVHKQQLQPQQPPSGPKLVKNFFDTVGPPNRTITDTNSNSSTVNRASRNSSNAMFGNSRSPVLIQDPSFHLIAGADVPLTSSIVVRNITTTLVAGGALGDATAGASSNMAAAAAANTEGCDGPSPEMAVVPSCAVVEGKSPLEEIDLGTN